MTIRFVARAASADEEPDYECLSAGVSENQDGTGFALIFQCSLHEPDEQDAALGMDSYCVVTADQGTDYGSVTEVVLKDNVLRVVVTPEARQPLGLEDNEIEATLDVDQDAIERLREGLRRILTYGRLSARPKHSRSDHEAQHHEMWARSSFHASPTVRVNQHRSARRGAARQGR